MFSMVVSLAFTHCLNLALHLIVCFIVLHTKPVYTIIKWKHIEVKPLALKQRITGTKKGNSLFSEHLSYLLMVYSGEHLDIQRWASFQIVSWV